MTNPYTLPEITIEGDPDRLPTTPSDWWSDGFVAGFNQPDTVPERPMLLNDELTAVYFAGFFRGREARQEMEIEQQQALADMPQLVGPIDGEPLEEIERRYREAWEGVFHQHDPHTELEGEVQDTTEPIRPNIYPVE